MMFAQLHEARNVCRRIDNLHSAVWVHRFEILGFQGFLHRGIMVAHLSVDSPLLENEVSDHSLTERAAQLDQAGQKVCITQTCRDGV